MSFFSKAIFQIGAKYRNPTLWKHYNDLKTTEKYSLDELKNIQEHRLIELLKFAGNNSPYYKKIFTDLSITSEAITMDDFKKIPLISKNDLLKFNKQIHRESKFEKEFFCETSGTSGQVLTFLRNESWDSFNRASIMRGYSWYNVNPWDYNLYFWGYNTKKTKKIKIKLLDFLVNRYRIFDYNENSLLKLDKKLSKVKYIEGYSSMIYELALLMKDRNIESKGIGLVKGTSEKIYPHYQKAVKDAFGKKLISEYGAAESGIIAFECKEGNMHINMEGVYIETDENNEIIVTNLHSYSFPVIRYRLGDIIKLAPKEKKCACGMEHPIIEEVTGRVGKNIYGFLKKYPSLTFYYIFKNIFFDHGVQLNYQAHQEEVGKLDIWIKEGLTDKIKDLILTESEKYFGNDIKIRLLHKEDFRQQSGKLRDFITELE